MSHCPAHPYAQAVHMAVCTTASSPGQHPCRAVTHRHRYHIHNGIYLQYAALSRARGGNIILFSLVCPRTGLSWLKPKNEDNREERRFRREERRFRLGASFNTQGDSFSSPSFRVNLVSIRHRNEQVVCVFSCTKYQVLY